jgi:ABC-type phosphate transport system permease subunit
MFAKRSSASITRRISLMLVCFPVVFLALMIVNVIWNSIPAITTYGFPVLFSTKFSNVFSGIYIPGQYGLLPALWGTVLIAILALGIALPISLAVAIFASEFSLKGLGRVMELVMSVFSGIPPIIYSLLSIFVLTAFIRPKLTGLGFPEDYLISLMGAATYKGHGIPVEKSTILGGICLALLIIPFMSPLILDAIRCVPNGLKEASLGLGATRWYTLWRITLPASISGIMAAISIGVFKTIGDVMISAWTIGYTRDGLPSPLIDIFESVPPLTATGAGLLNGLQPGSAAHQTTTQDAVAFFSALLLMALAFLILAAINLTQNLISRRMQHGR